MSDFPVKEYPFTIHVPDADLDLLQRKLDSTRLPDELELDGSQQWTYGTPLSSIKRLVARWREGYDWRKSEAEINKLPMYTRDISVDNFGTLNIHYVHQRSNVLDAIPLLFVHGWPGHFLEVRKLLPLLTEESADHPSFHVVAVSLPGYAFSEAPTKPGFGAPQFAEVFNKLMISLGYEEYVYQGGDWAHVLGIRAANMYGGRHIKAWHTNCPITKPKLSTILAHPSLIPRILASPFVKDAREAYATSKRYLSLECAYMKEQETRPQTLGYSLADSPVGLLAWIYEKLVAWSDDYPWTDDEVLEWVSIYWFSRAGPAASLRIYYEMSHGGTGDFFHGTQWIPIPTGVSYFPGEIVRLPKSWTRLLGNVVYQVEHDQGGHFAAHEVPERLACDLRKMFGRGGPAFGVVPGRSGYSLKKN
ncbi:alpha/beta-hydrolase [Lentinus brumalis]|uniref:Alpha/beta-hydrolase n=1 Tax=Lentinus brumalis TaxID=2498619 RepID=A0A371D1T6_9APHY|nr:alpha/beta-hydrolase [Polyporus brumalis]